MGAPAVARRRRPIRDAGPPRRYDYAGALHIHSTYSDGIGTVAEIAEAANAAGLDFLLLCDHSNLDAHGNGEDGWHGRTLVLVGTEVTTDAGHLLALDVPQSFLPAPAAAAEAQRAIQDSGGFGYIALPCDLKDHWRDFAHPARGHRAGSVQPQFHRARQDQPAGLPAGLAALPGRRPQRAFHWVAARPSRELRLWDALTADARPRRRPHPRPRHRLPGRPRHHEGRRALLPPADLRGTVPDPPHPRRHAPPPLRRLGRGRPTAPWSMRRWRRATATSPTTTTATRPASSSRPPRPTPGTRRP